MRILGGKIFGSSVLQLKYGFYTKIQNDFGRDWGAGGL